MGPSAPFSVCLMMMNVFFSLLGALVADGHASASSAVKQRREDVFAQGVGDNWDKEWQSVDVHGIWSYLVPVFCSTKKKRNLAEWRLT